MDAEVPYGVVEHTCYSVVSFFHHSDEHLMTPFARILSRLGQVKMNMEVLLGHYLKRDGEDGDTRLDSK